MGISRDVALFLYGFHSRGVTFRNMVTLGHQFLTIDKQTIRYLKHKGQVNCPDDIIHDVYAERFFTTFLGAEQVSAIDATSYEGADIIHDMNTPIPCTMTNKYDVVLDGGTLEHIFNFPVAIENCMKMVKPGGHLFIITVANNFFGHGFYQFSPELFFRVLSPENGFQIKDMVIFQCKSMNVEYGSLGKWYRVVDPDKVKSRVTLITPKPILLMLCATKVTSTSEIFRYFPQQSDYIALWNKAGRQEARLADRLHNYLIKKVPNAITALKSFYKNTLIHHLRNRRFYQPVDPASEE